jgi:hypothetical protein
MERGLALSVTCKRIPVTLLEAETKSEMWRLFDAHYVGLAKENFEADLMAKDEAILLYRENKLVGFTSLGSQNIKGHRVIYSGDIVIAPFARDIGSAHFFHHWAQAVWEKYDWWCLLTSGPRTYRIAHTFYKKVNSNKNETNSEKTLRHLFAKHIYGEQYDETTGIVKLRNPYRIKALKNSMRSNYPKADLFQKLNPDWERGDELVSIISLQADNWKPIALRVLDWKAE